MVAVIHCVAMKCVLEISGWCMAGGAPRQSLSSIAGMAYVMMQLCHWVKIFRAAQRAGGSRQPRWVERFLHLRLHFMYMVHWDSFITDLVGKSQRKFRPVANLLDERLYLSESGPSQTSWCEHRNMKGASTLRGGPGIQGHAPREIFAIMGRKGALFVHSRPRIWGSIPLKA